MSDTITSRSRILSGDRTTLVSSPSSGKRPQGAAVSPRKRPERLRDKHEPYRPPPGHEPIPSPLGYRPRGLIDYRQVDRKSTCIATFCNNDADRRYRSMLCQEHILGIWLMVEEDMRRAGITAEAIREAEEARLKSTMPATPVKTDGQVYYLRVDDCIKIGYTSDLRQRLGQYPPNAELLAHNPGTREDEKRIHKKFHAYLSVGREWFRDVPEIRKHIAEQVARHGEPTVAAPYRDTTKHQPVQLRKRSGRR